ncbi:unnamed protein product [Mytilus edulis]|uniref:Sacsin/Nov domain-containing protein n=1 Tax=Mytilus edulis TaxID=6550 RepID=A0A8S3VHK3_MYTED|nr:unnamed protein product [Mytilus edulis]
MSNTKKMTSKDKLDVLHFILSSWSSPSLVGIELLPLQNGGFTLFGKREQDKRVILCEEEMELFPGQEDVFCKHGLQTELYRLLVTMAENNEYQLCTMKELSTDDVATLLLGTIRKYNGKTTDHALRWKTATSTVAVDTLPKAIMNHEDINKFVYFPTIENVLQMLEDVTLPLDSSQAIQKFNKTCTEKERTKFANYIAKNSYLSSKVVNFISKLQIFKEKNSGRNVSSSERQQVTPLETEKWIWSGSGFEPSCNMILKTTDSDISLKPYLFSLPPEIRIPKLIQFFKRMNCVICQDTDLLLRVLQMIQHKYEGRYQNERESKSDLHLCMKILNSLKECDDIDERVLIPVYTNTSGKVILKLANECNYCNDDWLKGAAEDDGDEIYYVHPDISHDTAVKLGVPSLTDKLLQDTEGIEEWGQNEPLTTRINKLIQDYKDGLSVPKEIVQNADDAGATKIVIFDPHTTYLGSALKNKNQPGIKIDTRKNQHVLKRMSSQFEPYNGVFGCNLNAGNGNQSFDGTLFRFPLRTEQQANTPSKISDKVYNRKEMEELIEIFVKGVRKFAVCLPKM